MFRNWGFLLTEIWVLLLLAALLGLLVGWIIWGRRKAGAAQTEADLRSALRVRDQRIDALEGDLARARAESQTVGMTAANAGSAGDQSALVAELQAENVEYAAELERLRADAAHDAGLRGDLETARARIAALEADAASSPAASLAAVPGGAVMASGVDAEAHAAVQGELAAKSAALADANRQATERDAAIAALQAKVDAAPVDLSAELAACRDAGSAKDRQISELRAALEATEAAREPEQTPVTAPAAAAFGSIPGAGSAGTATERANAPGFHEDQAAAPQAPPASAPYAQGDMLGGDMFGSAHGEGVKPEALDAPRGGQADDLKRVKGIGPKLEKLCNKLGFWHFEQIASWTGEEVAWVDRHLEGFKGRVTRDNWVAQAKLLATGGETEFSKKVDKGDVYE